MHVPAPNEVHARLNIHDSTRPLLAAKPLPHRDGHVSNPEPAKDGTEENPKGPKDLIIMYLGYG